MCAQKGVQQFDITLTHTYLPSNRDHLYIDVYHMYHSTKFEV